MNIPGGWSDFSSPVTGEAKTVFDKVMAKWDGVQYTPIAAAEQIVSGKNYGYICLARTVVPEASVTVVKVIIYVPLSGEPHVIAIQQVAP